MIIKPVRPSKSLVCALNVWGAVKTLSADMFQLRTIRSPGRRSTAKQMQTIPFIVISQCTNRIFMRKAAINTEMYKALQQ